MSQDLEKQVRDEEMGRLRKTANMLHDSLVSDKGKNKLPEDVFKHHFLPFFSGQPVEPERKVIAEWIGVAGSPASEVDVVNDNGDVIFTVPSMVNTNVMSITQKHVGQGMSDIIDNYRLHSASVPVVGQRYIQTALDEKLKELIPNHIDLNPATEQWNKIFSRYGLIDEKEVTSKKNNDAEDDLEYD